MYYLKKAFAFTAILCIALAMSACGAEDLSDSKYLGTWVAVRGELVGIQTEIETIYTITLNPDGTATEVTDSTDENCTWEEMENGVTLKQSGRKLCMVDDGSGGLTIEQEGVVITFVRQ